jgi:hypothetical protein
VSDFIDAKGCVTLPVYTQTTSGKPPHSQFTHDDDLASYHSTRVKSRANISVQILHHPLVSKLPDKDSLPISKKYIRRLPSPCDKTHRVHPSYPSYPSYRSNNLPSPISHPARFHTPPRIHSPKSCKHSLSPHLHFQARILSLFFLYNYPGMKFSPSRLERQWRNMMQ